MAFHSVMAYQWRRVLSGQFHSVRMSSADWDVCHEAKNSPCTFILPPAHASTVGRDDRYNTRKSFTMPVAVQDL